MTQEDKELLIKDLCARLPYHTNCFSEYADDNWAILTPAVYSHTANCLPNEIGIKPYLFPLSSMTEEQSIELFKLFGISLVDSIGADYIKINECTGITFFLDKGFDIETHLDKLIDWLNNNHFDYRGLIEKSLALDATGKNIY